ncbi:MAG TPA: hypothetical protein VEJ16_03415 [Alphaproteobacteria bacterium]|nr:hypothetical protein [Alphaproteobacteria bacterium]
MVEQKKVQAFHLKLRLRGTRAYRDVGRFERYEPIGVGEKFNFTGIGRDGYAIVRRIAIPLSRIPNGSSLPVVEADEI